MKADEIAHARLARSLILINYIDNVTVNYVELTAAAPIAFPKQLERERSGEREGDSANAPFIRVIARNCAKLRRKNRARSRRETPWRPGQSAAGVLVLLGVWCICIRRYCLPGWRCCEVRMEVEKSKVTRCME